MRKLIFLIVILILTVGAAFAADNFIVPDPLTIGTGARPLGMGKAYVALAEDGDGIFVNPAGLGNVKQAKLTSMYSNFMDETSYILIGGAYPSTSDSAFGAGAVLVNTGGIALYDVNGASQGSASWNNGVIFLSYGRRIPEAKLKVGGNLKYYYQGGTGSTAISDASTSGFGFDVGAIYDVRPDFSLGISLQNPFSVKMESAGSVENTILSTAKLGAKLTLIPVENQKLNLLTDFDIIKNRQTAFHFGAEWFPVKNIAIRAGFDQDPAPDEVVTNLTLGLGLNFSGMQFNYAYHPYEYSGQASHFFSLAYVGYEIEDDEATLSLALLSPRDKSIIYKDHVTASGIAKGKGVHIVNVNGTSVPVDPKTGKFSFSIPVSEVGKKLVRVEAEDIKGNKVAKNARILRLVSFKDVGSGYWAKKPIEHSGTVGLVRGYPDGTFRPDRELTRAELATLLVRARDLKPMGKPVKVFKDVKTSHWAAGYIEVAKRMKIVKGYPDGKFRPNRRITKAEAITVLARYDNLAIFKPLEQKPFVDVSTRHWAAPYIQAAKESGMLNYLEDRKKLRPKENVSRAESVEMLSHTSLASKLIEDLLSWDKGFQYDISKPTIKAGL